ncbi:MAG: hypothetical protein MJ177_08100 [Clostridia bacterium]|nr:hypothetical protein [Clostridia bacterium]
MLEQVERKLEELDRMKKQAYYRQKDEDLMSWGLTTQTKGKKEVPIIITDDEYEELKKAARGTDYTQKGNSRFTALLKALAIITALVGLVAGIVLYLICQDSALKLVYLSLCWIGGIVFCFIFLGIVEIIHLLNCILQDK